MEKRAYQTTLPFDLVSHYFTTPSVFPVDHHGGMITMLRAAEEGDANALMILSSLRGKEGSPEYNMAINQLIAMQKAREAGKNGHGRIA